MKPKGKAFTRIQTAALSPTEGSTASLKRSLGFYRVILVGQECGRGALRGKELLQAKKDYSRQNYFGGMDGGWPLEKQ